MAFLGVAAALHFLAGLGLGYFFTVMILPLAIGLSIAGTFLVSLAIPFNIGWPTIIGVIALQLGYAAGSIVSGQIAARARARSKDDSIEADSTGAACDSLKRKASSPAKTLAGTTPDNATLTGS